ncbi:MAG: VanW family protein [Actinomycetota bacterium]
MRRRTVTACVAVLALLAGSLGTALASDAGEILKGVTAAGIPVSGLNARQASAKLATAAKAVEGREVKLVVGQREWTRNAVDLGIAVDMQRTVDAALGVGRSDPVSWVKHRFGGRRHNVAWKTTVDQTRLEAALKDLAKRVHVQASDGTVVFSESQVIISVPTEGIDLSVDATRRQFIDGFLEPHRKLPLSVTITSPLVEAVDVQRVEQQARVLLSRPAVFMYEGQTFTVDPSAVSRVLRVRLIEDPEDNKSASLVLQADADALDREIAAVAPWTLKPARSARFNIEGTQAVLVPSEAGSSVDSAAAAFSVVEPGNTAILLLSKQLPPDFTTEQAQALGITSRISTFTTFFDPRNAPRVTNIDLMANAIDETILKPGDVFSLNDATGPRTPQNGYQEANIIVDGELVPGIGGGVCQVATTLFNASFTAGLEIVERSNHSLYISKYPIGRDAMVNYGTQDLKFRNDTRFGLLLKARLTKKAMIVDVYSSPLGRRVEESASQQFNPKPFETKYIDDPSLPTGQEVVVEEGAPGFDIRVIRTVFEEDRVLHTDTLLSKYRPWKRIIRRGTGQIQGG